MGKPRYKMVYDKPCVWSCPECCFYEKGADGDECNLNIGVMSCVDSCRTDSRNVYFIEVKPHRTDRGADQ